MIINYILSKHIKFFYLKQKKKLKGPNTKQLIHTKICKKKAIKCENSVSRSKIYILIYDIRPVKVQSPHNANGYYTIYGDETDYNDHFNAKLVTGATTEVYARTGYLGFLRRTECSQSVSVLDETTPSIASRDSDNDSLNSFNQSHLNSSNILTSELHSYSTPHEQQQHDAVYVVGALDEVISLRGMNYHPIDIENSVMRCHKKIAEW